MGKRILAVDDSATLRQMVNFTLSEAGYEVVEAADGQEALTRLNEDPVHLIITDLNMPEMDGLTLIRKVRARHDCKFLPIIMLTTESQADKKMAGREAGATGWIVKPFTPKQLVNVVMKVLG